MKKLIKIGLTLVGLTGLGAIGFSFVEAQQAPGQLVGGVYNSTPATLSDKQSTTVQLDTDGNLKVNVAAGGASGGTSSSFNAAFPATGTAAGMKSGANMVPFVSTDGTAVDVNCTVGCSGGSFNNNADNVATSATNGQAAAWGYVFDGSTWDRLRGTSADGALVNLGANNDVTVTGTVSGTGTAGSAATGVLTVQGIASMTPLLSNTAIGTAAAPSYSEGVRNALSMELDGDLRVYDTTLDGLVTTTNADIGAPGATACATDSGSCSLNAKLSRIAQNVTALIASLGGTGTIAAAVPSTATYNGINVGGNLTGMTGLSAGADNTTNSSIGPITHTFNYVYDGSTWDRMPGTSAAGATVSGAGTAGSAAAGVLSVQGIASMTPLLANPGTAANWGVGATGSAPPANAEYMGANGSGATGGQLRGMITCDQHAKYDASDTGSITMVTGVSGRKIYICGYIMATGGTATNLKLREGSDANCASNAADLTPAYQLVANDKIGAMSAFWSGLVISTNAYYVCVNASAANAHQAEIWYAIL